jgi:hypothetical protein
VGVNFEELEFDIRRRVEGLESREQVKDRESSKEEKFLSRAEGICCDVELIQDLMKH